jgi:hypothetical protein
MSSVSTSNGYELLRECGGDSEDNDSEENVREADGVSNVHRSMGYDVTGQADG